jgi:phosphoribosylamine--glycine ligase
MGFTDGKTVRLLPTAADHKRLHDGDQGPNTGGMGAYAPTTQVGPGLLQQAVDGLAEEGRPFVGVLYAGLMLTKEGPKVLEFNCRLGDPETQALLPLLDTPLAEIVQACVEGRLHELQPRWKEGSAACVVAAAPGYPAKPETGAPIDGLDDDLPDTMVFHAGTRAENQNVVTAGGRVLGVTGWGADRSEALQRAYARLQKLSFPGMHYRRDIGR